MLIVPINSTTKSNQSLGLTQTSHGHLILTSIPEAGLLK